MSPDEITQITEAVDIVIGRRMEEVYGTIEELRQQVADAVQGINATAQVLHDNDTAIMGHMMQQDGSMPAEFTAMAGDAWRRFIEAEARELGLRIVVAKS